MLHPDLIPKIVGLREKVAQFLSQFQRGVREVDAGNLWKKWKPVENPQPVAAADSSFNFIKRLGFYLVGVSAAGVASGEPERVWGEFDLLPGAEDEDWVRFFLRASSGILEAKAWVFLKNKGVLLVDGSLSVAARRLRDELSPGRAFRWARVEEDPEAQRRLLRAVEELAPEVRQDKEGVLFWESLKELEWIEGSTEFRRGAATLLAREEYRQAFLRALVDGKLVAVAKTSADSTIIEGVPDIYVLSKITLSPGFTEPKEESLSIEGLKVFFVSFYARLEPRRGVIKVEVLGREGEVDPERVLATLLATAKEGYPYLLSKAHNLCTLHHATLERVLELAGAKLEPSGREGL